MEKKRRTLDQLSDAGQDVISLLRSAEAGAKIEADTEELTLRWDNLVQKLEDCSFQVWFLFYPFLLHAGQFKLSTKCTITTKSTFATTKLQQYKMTLV